MNYNFKKDFKQINKIVLKHDPIGLVDGGAPDDEYDDRVMQIVSALQRINDSGALANEILKIFGKEFDLKEVSFKKCQRIAKSIIIRKWIMKLLKIFVIK